MSQGGRRWPTYLLCRGELVARYLTVEPSRCLLVTGVTAHTFVHSGCTRRLVCRRFVEGQHLWVLSRAIQMGMASWRVGMMHRKLRRRSLASRKVLDEARQPAVEGHHGPASWKDHLPRASAKRYMGTLQDDKLDSSLCW